MDENLHHIDQLFKTGIENYTEAPGNKPWEKMEHALDKDTASDFRRRYYYLKRLAAAALIGCIAMGAVLYLRETSQKELAAPVADSITQPETLQIPVAPVRGNNTLPVEQQQKPTTPQQPTSPQFSPKSGKAIQQNDHAFPNEKPTQQESNQQPSETPAVSKEYPLPERKMLIKPKNFIRRNSLNKSFNIPLQEIKSAITYSKEKNRQLQLRQQQKEMLLTQNFQGTYPKTSIPAAREVFALQALGKDRSLNRIYIAAPEENAKASLLLSPTKQSIRNAYRNKLHRTGLIVYYNLGMIQARSAPGKREHIEDDYKMINRDEKVTAVIEAGIAAEYRLSGNWQIQGGISYSQQHSSIEGKTVFVRRDERRPRGGNNQDDLRYKFNCSAGYVYLDPKSGQTVNFGDSVQTLPSSNKISYVTIPLTVSYQFTKKRFAWGPSAGIHTNILSRAELKTTLQESTGTKIPQTATVNGLRSFYLSGTLGFVAKYQLNENFSLYLMPHHSFSLGSINEETPARTFINKSGMQLGLRMGL